MKPYFSYSSFFFPRTLYFFNIIITVVRLICLLKQKKKGQCQGRSTSALETPRFSLALCFVSVFLYEALKKIDPKFPTDPFQTFPDFGESIPLSRFPLFVCFFIFTVRQLYYFEFRPPRPSLVPWQEIFLDWVGSKLCATVRAPSIFGKPECFPSLFFFFNVMLRVFISV